MDIVGYEKGRSVLKKILSEDEPSDHFWGRNFVLFGNCFVI